MNMVSGGRYTLSFAPSGIDLSGPFSDQGTAVVDSLIKGGFPLGNPTWTQGGTGLGYLNISDINVSFVYNGTDTDSDTLGQAMASELNADFSLSSFTYSGAVGENVAAPGSATATAQEAAAAAAAAAKAALPSTSTIVIVVAIGLLAVAVYSFSGAAASKAL